MLKNIKIIVRLAAMLGAMLVLMAALSTVGIFGMASVREGLRTVYEDRVIPMEQLGQIEADYYQIRIAILDAINANDAAAIAKDADTIGKLVDEATGTWNAYLSTYLTPQEKTLVDELEKSF